MDTHCSRLLLDNKFTLVILYCFGTSCDGFGEDSYTLILIDTNLNKKENVKQTRKYAIETSTYEYDVNKCK